MPERERSADDRRLSRADAADLCVRLATGGVSLDDALRHVLA